MIMRHQFQCVFDTVFRTQEKRIRDHAVFGSFDPIHFGRLLFDRAVLVDDADPAFSSHRDCHARSRYRIHPRAH